MRLAEAGGLGGCCCALGDGGLALAAVELADDAGDVGAGFGEGRDAVVAVDGSWAGVVGGDGEADVVVVAGEELVEVGGAAGDVLLGREGVVDAEDGRGGGHQLHEALRAGAGDGAGVAVRFGMDDGGEQVGVDVVQVSSTVKHRLDGCLRGSRWRG